MDDASLVAALESCTLDPAAFSHRAHVQAAWHYLRIAPFGEAGDRFCRALQRFAASVGRPEKFHATVSWAYLALIHERSLAAPAETFDAFAAANADLMDHARALSTVYDAGVLASDVARRVFVLPRRSVT